MEPAKVELITKEQDSCTFKYVCWELCLRFDEKINSIAKNYQRKQNIIRAPGQKAISKIVFLHSV